jgi:hypothetical protein
MREPYVEGLAARDGPESCIRSGNGAGEALTGVRVGRAIEPRNHRFGVPTPSPRAEGNIPGGVSRELSGDPARSWEPVHARNLHVREPGDPMLARRRDRVAGRLGKAEVVRLG